jgi:nucleoside-diphosphate-sugar epimerase
MCELMKAGGDTILVTGATGFIGARVCERLVQAGDAKVRALVHQISNAARIGRLPIELCRGDLLDPESLQHALSGISAVIHCGLGFGPAIPKGTKNLLKAAESTHAIRRFVHVSTAAVYGLTPGAECFTESANPRHTGNSYCDNKLKAEQIVLRFHNRGIPTVILRPSIVLGPYSRWSIRELRALRTGNAWLIDDGKGICNSTYVDNLVDAIFLAIENESAAGHKFFITDGEPVSWRQFTESHRQLLKECPEPRVISSSEVLARQRNAPGLLRASLRATPGVLASSEFRDLVKRVPAGDRMLTWAWDKFQNCSDETKDRIRARLRGRGSQAPDRSAAGPDAEFCAIRRGEVVFSIERARDLLGYSPRVSFSAGMERTAEWLRFANYLN